MSLSAALNSSLSSLLTLQQQTRLVSANVANAQQQDYTRKNVNLNTPAIQGLPVGVQLVGRPFEDERVLRAAHVLP